MINLNWKNSGNNPPDVEIDRYLLIKKNENTIIPAVLAYSEEDDEYVAIIEENDFPFEGTINLGAEDILFMNDNFDYVYMNEVISQL